MLLTGGPSSVPVRKCKRRHYGRHQAIRSWHVVDRAMMLFWRKGYGGTSIQHLEKATRLRRGSLYNAFGDKQGLFVAALKRYETTVSQERVKQLSNPDPYRAIEGFLETLVTQMSE